MLPRNVIEAEVHQVLAALRLRDPGDGATCWCPLCSADMQALALCALPPRYVTRREDRAAMDAGRGAAVREEVAHAVQQVGSHRKHPPGEEARDPARVALVNVAYEVAFELIAGRMLGRPGVCGCFECRCDAVAFALNRFPPRYGVALGGRSLYTDLGRREIGAEMTSFLDLGVSVVSGHPRH